MLLAKCEIANAYLEVDIKVAESDDHQAGNDDSEDEESKDNIRQSTKGEDPSILQKELEETRRLLRESKEINESLEVELKKKEDQIHMIAFDKSGEVTSNLHRLTQQ